MKRLIIFILFLGVTAGAYYYYDLSDARFKKEREVLVQQIEEKKKAKELELRGMVDAAEKVKKEAEEKANSQKGAMDQLVKAKDDGEKAIRERKKTLQDELKTNSEEKREEIKKQAAKYTVAIGRLNDQLKKAQQAEIDAKETVARSYEEKIKSIEIQIGRVDKSRREKEAAILAKSNVPDPEKYMVMRDANRKAAEEVIVRLQAQIDKVRLVMDKAFEEVNQAKHEFYERPAIAASVRKIEAYEKEKTALMDQLGRLMSGRVTDKDPEIAPMWEKQKEYESKLTSMKSEYQKMVGDASRARTKAISVDRMFNDQVAAVAKTDALDDLDKKSEKFWNIFYGVCGLTFLALLFMFFKAGDSAEAA